MTTISILDGFTTNPGDLSWEGLYELGELTCYDRTAASERTSRVKGQEVLITNKVILDEETLNAAESCRFISLLSTGTNSVDLEACRKRGIPVSNVPAYSTASVAEHTIALLMDQARAVGRHADAVREGEWTRSVDFCFTLTPQRELHGLTLGLIGFGEIAQAVARIAVAMGMRVLVYTPNPGNKPDLGQTFGSLDDVLAESDAVSLHCPLSPETAELINRERLGRMKQGAVLINTGRGGLLDESAVAEALNSGILGAACLDVLSDEPPTAGNPLLRAPNCRITPHVAWATREARKRLIDIVVANVQAFLDGRPQNVVNGL